MSSPTKDNEILRYYEAEMRYLREAGREFARAFPDRARELDLDRLDERDPHVERLFEGFAFLMGRLRHKLDDELPELTECLVSMLWPHYLRMILSLAILELKPNLGSLQKHEVVAAGLEATSDPISTGTANNDARATCVYRTTQPVDIYPLSLTEAGSYAREDGRSVVRLRFALQAQHNQLDVPRLRLYLHGGRWRSPCTRRSRQHPLLCRCPIFRSSVLARRRPCRDYGFPLQALRPKNACGQRPTTRSAATSFYSSTSRSRRSSCSSTCSDWT